MQQKRILEKQYSKNNQQKGIQLEESQQLKNKEFNKQTTTDILRQIKADTAQTNEMAIGANKKIYEQDEKLKRIDNKLDDIHSINKKNNEIADDLNKGFFKTIFGKFICCDEPQQQSQEQIQKKKAKIKQKEAENKQNQKNSNKKEKNDNTNQQESDFKQLQQQNTKKKYRNEEDELMDMIGQDLDNIQVEGKKMKQAIQDSNQRLDQLNNKTDKNIKQQQVISNKLAKY